MLDCFDYKCLPLSEIPPVIRISNKWPELPPEESNHTDMINWEGLFGELKRLYEAGATREEIAWELHLVSLDTLGQKMREWIRTGRIKKVRHPREAYKWSAESERVMFEMLAEGKAAVDVAKRLGLSAPTVKYHAYRLGWEYVGKRWLLALPAA